MGNHWRDSLQSDYQTDPLHEYHDGEVIIRPSASPANKTAGEDLGIEEVAHCVRMRCCGAIAFRSEIDAASSAIEGWRDPPRQIFGWPSTGGVWILRYPELEVHDDIDLWRRHPEITRDFRRTIFQHDEVRESLRQYTDMDDLSRALKSAGPKYYAAIADCPRVVKLVLHVR